MPKNTKGPQGQTGKRRSANVLPLEASGGAAPATTAPKRATFSGTAHAKPLGSHDLCNLGETGELTGKKRE